MQRDFKIGMLLGLILAMAGILWLSTRRSLTSAPAAESLGLAQDKLVNSKPVPPATSGPDSRSSIPDTRPFTADQASQRTTYDIRTTAHEPRFHIVRQDETLSAISQQYYGSPNNWQKIFQANRSRLKDPNRISPGTKLIIPD